MQNSEPRPTVARIYSNGRGVNYTGIDGWIIHFSRLFDLQVPVQFQFNR